MSALLQPLKFMVYRRQSVIATASLQFLPAESRHPGARAEVIQSLPSSGGDSPTTVIVLDNKLDKTEQEQRIHKDAIHKKAIEPMFIETKYGIRLEVADEDQELINISETSVQEETPKNSNKGKPARYHYRLFPDWQTSYLWYDLTQDTNPSDLDDPYVDLDAIEERYPTLSPYYRAWRQIYETEFEKQECHLGSGAEVFPDVDDRIAWNLEGFFLACWLALRSDVQSVEYIPVSVKYKIESGTIESVFLEFLRDIAKERRAVDQS